MTLRSGYSGSMSRALLRAGGIALIVLTSGCAFIPQPKPGTESGPNGELLVVSRTGPVDAVMEALFEGTLFLNEDSCVAGRTLDGQEVTMLFPQGSSLEGADELVIRSGDHRIALEVPVALGGGFVPSDEDDLSDVPDGCKYDETFLVQTIGGPGPVAEPSASSD